MSALEAVKQFIDDELRSEVYGESSVYSVLDMIDIEVGFGMDEQGRRTTLPVVETRCDSMYEHAVPIPSMVEMNGERYMISRPANADFDWFSEDSVKVMRARFLLLRDYYYPRIPSMSESMRREVVSRFFGGSVWTPPAGSELAKAMGFPE